MPEWDDALAADIATLSYESALKAPARYRPADQPLTKSAEPQPVFQQEPIAPATRGADRPETHEPVAQVVGEINSLRTTAFERNLKDASITIRMSKAESEQLHRRAAEAGLTVSAYLRSCTIEAESLRAMVKETMAQLRSATSGEKHSKPRFNWMRAALRWMVRLMSPGHTQQRVARAS